MSQTTLNKDSFVDYHCQRNKKNKKNKRKPAKARKRSKTQYSVPPMHVILSHRRKNSPEECEEGYLSDTPAVHKDDEDIIKHHKFEKVKRSRSPKSSPVMRHKTKSTAAEPECNLLKNKRLSISFESLEVFDDLPNGEHTDQKGTEETEEATSKSAKGDRRGTLHRLFNRAKSSFDLFAKSEKTEKPEKSQKTEHDTIEATEVDRVDDDAATEQNSPKIPRGRATSEPTNSSDSQLSLVQFEEVSKSLDDLQSEFPTTNNEPAGDVSVFIQTKQQGDEKEEMKQNITDLAKVKEPHEHEVAAADNTSQLKGTEDQHISSSTSDLLFKGPDDNQHTQIYSLLNVQLTPVKTEEESDETDDRTKRTQGEPFRSYDTVIHEKLKSKVLDSGQTTRTTSTENVQGTPKEKSVELTRCTSAPVQTKIERFLREVEAENAQLQSLDNAEETTGTTQAREHRTVSIRTVPEMTLRVAQGSAGPTQTTRIPTHASPRGVQVLRPTVKEAPGRVPATEHTAVTTQITAEKTQQFARCTSCLPQIIRTAAEATNVGTLTDKPAMIQDTETLQRAQSCDEATVQRPDCDSKVQTSPKSVNKCTDENTDQQTTTDQTKISHIPNETTKTLKIYVYHTTIVLETVPDPHHLCSSGGCRQAETVSDRNQPEITGELNITQQQMCWEKLVNLDNSEAHSNASPDRPGAEMSHQTEVQREASNTRDDSSASQELLVHHQDGNVEKGTASPSQQPDKEPEKYHNRHTNQNGTEDREQPESVNSQRKGSGGLCPTKTVGMLSEILNELEPVCSTEDMEEPRVARGEKNNPDPTQTPPCGNKHHESLNNDEMGEEGEKHDGVLFKGPATHWQNGDLDGELSSDSDGSSSVPHPDKEEALETCRGISIRNLITMFESGDVRRRHKSSTLPRARPSTSLIHSSHHQAATSSTLPRNIKPHPPVHNKKDALTTIQMSQESSGVWTSMPNLACKATAFDAHATTLKTSNPNNVSSPKVPASKDELQTLQRGKYVSSILLKFQQLQKQNAEGSEHLKRKTQPLLSRSGHYKRALVVGRAKSMTNLASQKLEFTNGPTEVQHLSCENMNSIQLQLPRIDPAQEHSLRKCKSEVFFTDSHESDSSRASGFDSVSETHTHLQTTHRHRISTTDGSDLDLSDGYMAEAEDSDVSPAAHLRTHFSPSFTSEAQVQIRFCSSCVIFFDSRCSVFTLCFVAPQFDSF